MRYFVALTGYYWRSKVASNLSSLRGNYLFHVNSDTDLRAWKPSMEILRLRYINSLFSFRFLSKRFILLDVFCEANYQQFQKPSVPSDVNKCLIRYHHVSLIEWRSSMSVCRSLLEQSADVKGQFARWHQQLSSSRSLSPSATPATKVVPLRALPVQSTSASSSSTSPPAGGDAATPSVWITPLKTLPEIHTGSSSSSSSSSPLASETFPSAAHGLPTFDHQSTQHTHG